MDHLRALAVWCVSRYSQILILRPRSEGKYIPIPTQHDLTFRTLTHSQVNHLGGLGRSRGIAAFEVAEDGGAVVDALDGDGGGADDVGQCVEERGPGERADVAELEGAAREDDGGGGADAVEEVVAGGREALAGVEGGWEGVGEVGEKSG